MLPLHTGEQLCLHQIPRLGSPTVCAASFGTNGHNTRLNKRAHCTLCAVPEISSQAKQPRLKKTQCPATERVSPLTLLYQSFQVLFA